MRIREVDDIGPVARQRRRDLELSQAEVARRAGVTRQWLVRFEQGNADVTLGKAFAVLRALGLAMRLNPSTDSAASIDLYRIPRADTVDAEVLDRLRERIEETRVKIADLDESRGKRSGGTAPAGAPHE
jgi:HTH-type transcriptional regulator/antitoxin HipB